MTNKELKDAIKIKDHEINDLIRSQAKKDLEIADLKDDIIQEQSCYQLAASRAKHFKSQITIIKETLLLKENT